MTSRDRWSEEESLAYLEHLHRYINELAQYTPIGHITLSPANWRKAMRLQKTERQPSRVHPRPTGDT